MLPVKKIYLSSKYKSATSVSNSNFIIDLPQTISLPANTTFIVDDVCIGHSWYNVETGINDKFYITVYNTPASQTNVIIIIPNGNYTGTTLATQLQTLLNNSNVVDPLAGIFTVTYNLSKNNINITATIPHTFFIWTDQQVTEAAYTFDNPADYDASNIASINNVLRNTESNVYVPPQSYTSNFLDFLTIDNIYLSSPNLGSFTTLGARGESNIIKKIPVTSDFGFMIIDRVTSNHDYLDCSKQTLRSIEFHLKDVKGNYIPLHGSDVSFSLVFSEFKE